MKVKIYLPMMQSIKNILQKRIITDTAFLKFNTIYFLLVLLNLIGAGIAGSKLNTEADSISPFKPVLN